MQKLFGVILLYIDACTVKLIQCFLQALGFDCEWVNENGHARNVSLLQLASASGTCVLVRMHLLAKCGFPDTLQKLLADRRFIGLI